jgi:hypothetical protein
MTSMPKGYVEGQVICSFLAQFYTHVVMAQQQPLPYRARYYILLHIHKIATQGHNDKF